MIHHIPETELLRAMKDALRDLENLKLLNPNDIHILNLRRKLRTQIDAMERKHSQASDPQQMPDYEFVP